MTISRKLPVLALLLVAFAESRLNKPVEKEPTPGTGKRRMPGTREITMNEEIARDHASEQRRMPRSRDNIFSPSRAMLDDSVVDDPEPTQFIVGGFRTNPDRFPYFASLYQEVNGEKYHVCGGTLIHDDIILTAAHCAKHSHRVRVGAFTALDDDANGDQPFHDSEVTQYTSHPSFYTDVLKRLHYDFALLRLKSPVTNKHLLDSMMNLDKVVEVDATIGNGEISEAVTAIGLGKLYDEGPMPKFLQEVELNYMSNKRCEHFFGSVPNEMMCAKSYQGRKDACTGDSGGPLIVKGDLPHEDTQIGVTSWGSGCATQYPGAYARISVVADWIKQETCKMSNIKPSYCAATPRTSVSRCVERDYCEKSNSFLPAGIWCFMNGSICQITCGKCDPEESISSSPAV